MAVVAFAEIATDKPWDADLVAPLPITF